MAGLVKQFLFFSSIEEAWYSNSSSLLVSRRPGKAFPDDNYPVLESFMRGPSARASRIPNDNYLVLEPFLGGPLARAFGRPFLVITILF